MIDLLVSIVVGGVIGVLVNYICDVLPKTRKFSKPVCDNCSKPFSLKGYLISFRCPNCGNKPPKRTMIVLVVSIISSVMVQLFPLGGLSYWLTIPLMVFLGVVLVIDIEHHAVLIETSVAGLIFLFIYGWLMQGLIITIVGGFAGFVIMLLIYFFGIFFSKTLAKIRKEDTYEAGMGFGDVYVCAFMGLFVGWPYVVGMIILAILASGFFSVFYLIAKSIKKDYRENLTIPYAPFLILGALAIYYIPPIPAL